ncbi:Phycocyanobilin lyase, CpcS-I subfamily [Acaryochloris thomasi RCC1774]|uniref:Chromophore lyase CpcS/CpeS n=1 Tax=Acaryochloris thomasi RCC1774 TaxID=1764569 RepID=A0A2W1JGM1_9CYAN|nr:phycobiliprotein lyase [Acaryochloris thomasi]PZD70775.1 Phycocyanobilin lyase, CpcS-I subfamily [Acaryochloris thomasi RCC1774]
MDVMAFFELSTGTWQSHRTTHHLAFKKAESGQFEIQVEALPASDPRIVELCQLHGVDSSLAVGGAYVGWKGSMAWDKENESHDSSSVFALIPDADHPRRGKLLREQGYAETVPVAGQYYMDEQDALVLTTEYEVMSSVERFWFASPNLRMRTSTVKRFESFTTATFCTELRRGLASVPPAAQAVQSSLSSDAVADSPSQDYSRLGS